MSTYEFCGGTCPQCPPGSATYAFNESMHVFCDQNFYRFMSRVSYHL